MTPAIGSTDLAPPFVVVNGIVTERDRAAVSVFDRGLLYGDGCFEGLRVSGGRLFRSEAHLDRMGRSLRALAMDGSVDLASIVPSIAELADANAMADAHVRVVVTRGSALHARLDPRGATAPTVVIMMSGITPMDDRLEPLRLVVSSVCRKAPRSMSAHIKSLNYLDGILAKQQAIAAGADDAVMLDAEGLVAEATAANLFAVRDGNVVTPTTRAALPGITRDTVISILRADGYSCREGELTWGDLYVADEVFLTGTAAGVRAVGAIDGRQLPEVYGTITAHVHRRYAEIVGSGSQSVLLADTSGHAR